MTVINTKPEKLEEFCRKLELGFDRFRDLLASDRGFMVSLSGMGFGDHGVCWLNIGVGRELIKAFREILEDDVGNHITDGRFMPHISIFKRNTMNDVTKKQLAESVQFMKLGPIVATGASLRSKKDKARNILSEILLSNSFQKTVE